VAGRARTGSFWPSPLQEQLLQVALGNPDGAVATWERLRPGFDLDRLEPGSFVLLPLTYRALVDGGSDEPLLPRLKGIYRSTWVKNNLLVERTRETHEVLAEAGVEPFFVGGVTVSAYYDDMGLRPTRTPTHPGRGCSRIRTDISASSGRRSASTSSEPTSLVPRTRPSSKRASRTTHAA
jgi:hypothetical protein